MTQHYYKQEDGQKIAIEVDLNAYAYSQKYSWLFSVFIKFELELDAKALLIEKLQKDELTKYVGSRVIDGWMELYFYAKDSKSLGNKVSSVLSTYNYPYEANVVKDAKWDFYNYNLYPSEMEFHHIQSQEIISALEDEGDDLSKERLVEHYVYFDTPTQKERYIKELSLEGFAYKDDIASEDFDNGIALMKTHDVLPETLEKVVYELYKSLDKDHGTYAGWSTTLA